MKYSLFVFFTFFNFSVCISQDISFDSIVAPLPESEFNSVIMNEVFENADVVSLGQRIAPENNDIVHIRMFKYLYDQYNYKKFVITLPRSSNRLLQKYIASGNEKYLDSVVSFFSDEKELHTILRFIYKLHKDDAEVNVIAINLEIETFSFQELCCLLKDEKYESASKKILTEVSSFELLSDKKIKKILEVLKKDMDENKEKLKKSMSAGKYEQYELILEQLFASVKCNKFDVFDKQILSQVDDILYKNFLDLIVLDDKSKYYVSCDFESVSKKENISWFGIKNWTSFLSRTQAEHKDLNFVSGIIYYINLEDSQKEFSYNSEIIKSERDREYIRVKTGKYAFMNVRSFENRIDFMLINNQK